MTFSRKTSRALNGGFESIVIESLEMNADAQNCNVSGNIFLSSILSYFKNNCKRSILENFPS